MIRMPPKGTKTTKGVKGGASYATNMESLYFNHYTEQSGKSGNKTAVLLQVGSFFEMYDWVDKETGKSFANVQLLAELCGCLAEPRPSPDPTRHRIFWGFPEHSLPKFERILVNAGYTVRVIVQKKDALGDVASRTIDHVSSPGTFYDAEGGLAIRKDEQIMLGLYIEPYVDAARNHKHWLLASSAFDVMTGKSISTETDITLIDGKPVLDAIQPFWSLYPPAEVVVYWSALTEPPSEHAIHAMFVGTTGKRPPVHIHVLDPKEESSVAAERLRLDSLNSIYKHNSALSINAFLGLEMYHTARKSLHHLLAFIKDHNPSFLLNLHEHVMWSAEDSMLLGNAALEQLAMLPSNSERSQESLLFWLQKARTAMGKRTLRERCLTPIADIEELDARQERIALLRADAEREPIEKILMGMYDLPRLYRRFQLGRGSTNDLLQLLATYEKGAQLVEQTKEKVFGIQEDSDLQTHIKSFLGTWSAERIRKSKNQVDDGIAVGSTHPWLRGIHADLDRMEDSWTLLETQMLAVKAEYEEAVEEADGITWTLKDDSPFTFTTTARRATGLNAVLKRRGKPEVDVVKRGSSTTVTLDTDIIRQANVQAIKLRSAWKSLVHETWISTWQTWFDTVIEEGSLETFVDWVGQLDAETTFASIANEYGYVRPTYVESTEDRVAGFHVMGLRHPIIERVSSVPYVSHNLSFGSLSSEDTAQSSCGMLLYGVNAAGKSSLGKAIGLSVLMAQCGMPVPASTMTLIPYTALFTRILGNDNLWAGMSSFVVEMTEFRSILRAAGPRTLVIGDELCAGTETASATAIVAAGIQTLISRKCNFFFATHLHELASIPVIAESPDVSSYHLTVHPDLENGALVYDRMLKKGCGSPMYGLEVCRGLDMDAEFLKAAFDFRKQLFDASGSRLSKYNATLVVSACEVCGSHKDLETHHIVPQAAADAQGRIAPGKHKNTKENLVVLCDACHDKHHKGMLDIQGWKQTTHGKRLITTSS